MNRHISEQYDTELDRARSLLMEMGGLVEHQLQQACQSLYNHDSELADLVKASDSGVNQLEVKIDDLCIQIIARRQPTATDLRTLVSIMKASTDLERIGDESTRVAKMARNVANLSQPQDHYGPVRAMADQVHVMLANALDAFARLSAETALEVIEQDEVVDKAYDSIVRRAVAELKTRPDDIERSVTLLWIARALERCGDHAKNISESIVYLVKGQDVRYGDAAAALTDR